MSGVSQSLRDGIAAAQARQFDRARPLLERATSDSPTDPIGWFWLAIASASAADAMRCLRRVLEIDVAHEQARNGLVTLLQTEAQRLAAAGLRAEARDLAAEATRLAPASQAVWLSFAALTDDQKERLELLKFAVHAFASLGSTAVYLDAGHSSWLPAAEIAARLKDAGLAEADGFSLNVSNYKATDTEIKYGKEISKLVGGKHFVIDTSRNGMGPPVAECKLQDSEACWCNPPGRGLGSPPTAQTADPLVDAYLWLKKQGESDGECNGGPGAGQFWLEQALELAR